MRILPMAMACLISGLPLQNWASTPAPINANEQSYLHSDAALGSFVTDVVASNPRVQAAQAAVDASAAYELAAGRPLYNPSLEFEAENAADQTRTIGISHTFDWSGKRSARSAVASSDRLAVEAEYFAIRQEVTVELLSGLAATKPVRCGKAWQKNAYS